MTTSRLIALASLPAVLVACGGAPEPEHAGGAAARQVPGTATVVRDTQVTASITAPGTAEPVEQSTLGTRLMGTVTAVLVKEGDRVSHGQVLARIDARDVTAKAEQVRAGIAAAEAARGEAALHASRMRALLADSAAPQAQVDAAEAGLARADAALRAARAGEAEVGVMSDYAVIRAPFAGVVTQRWVDPGAFAAPGAPLLTVQDQRTLRVAATVVPTVARALTRGGSLPVSIEGVEATARVEAVVPAPAGGLYTVNATVDNRAGRFASGGTATVHLPRGTRTALLVPRAAIVEEGNLRGVTVRGPSGDATRWVRLGDVFGDQVEVTAGLSAGETIVVPTGTGTA